MMIWFPSTKLRSSIGAGEPFAVGETIPAWRACEVDGGAYYRRRNPDHAQWQQHRFCYVQWNDIPVRMVPGQMGDGKLEILANGLPLSDAGTGMHEIKIICHGELQVMSICFE